MEIVFIGFLSLLTKIGKNDFRYTDIRILVIDQLMVIKDAEYLRALSDMIDHSSIVEKKVPLTEEQK